MSEEVRAETHLGVLDASAYHQCPEFGKQRARKIRMMFNMGMRGDPRTDHAVYRQCPHCGVMHMRVDECPYCYRKVGR